MTDLITDEKTGIKAPKLKLLDAEDLTMISILADMLCSMDDLETKKAILKRIDNITGVIRQNEPNIAD